MILKPPFSYSHIALYESCPHKHNLQRIQKIVPDEESHPAAARGTLLHEACEAYINGEMTTLPPELKSFAPVLDKLKAQGAKSEVKLACTINREPCAYDSPDAYFYGIIDTLEIEGSVSQIGDWKSGKERDYSNQLSFYAMLQLINSDSKKILTRIRYLDAVKSVPGVAYTRGDLDFLWLKFNELVIRMINDRIRSPRPNEFCKYCPYNKNKMGVCKW